MLEILWIFPTGKGSSRLVHSIIGIDIGFNSLGDNSIYTEVRAELGLNAIGVFTLR